MTATVNNAHEATGKRRGVGAAVRRREDSRHLHGVGMFVADVCLPGMRDIAFIRSQVAHGRIVDIACDSVRASDIWTAHDLAADVTPLVATSSLPGFQEAPLPYLAQDKVRYVGEPIAAVIGTDRAAAEDTAARVQVEIEPLPVVVDAASALAPDAALLHDTWRDNAFVVSRGEFGDIATAVAEAAVTVTRKYRMNRQAVVPLETRGVIAFFDRSVDQLVLWSSTQTPHMVRDLIAETLGLDGHRVRVIAPDMGGGFGTKCTLYPEEVVLAAIAMRVSHPVRWIEDRWENMVSATQARDHDYEITAHAAADGTILGIEADVTVNCGAYSIYPWTGTMDSSMAAAMIPGPYKIRNYRYTARSVATNTTPCGPYRGVARPGACFAIERTIDEVARELGLDPVEVRLRNLVQPDDMPYTSVTNKRYDSGDYPEALRRVRDIVAAWETDASGLTADNTAMGIGYGMFCEQTAHGCIEWAARGLSITVGTESARLVMDATGSLTLYVGIKSHGQGLETTLAQVVGEVLDVDVDAVSVIHGDTAMTPRGDGTFASRSMVMAGGAADGAARRLAGKIRTAAGGLLGEDPDSLHFRDGAIVGSTASLTFAELARTFQFRPDHIPDIEGGLEATFYYRSEIQTGAFTYAANAALVEVDLDTGLVKVLRYAVVEDCGTIVNPLIVDGQILGGLAQGIGNALLEEVIYDDLGQPKTTSFMDYMLPGATEMPEIDLHHMQTPSPHTVHGVKGAGEGGAIAPPATIANAVAHALADFGAHVGETPMTPLRVWAALEQVRKR